MKHKYTVEYYKCPKCGKTLKTVNPMGYLALSILTAFLPWLWFWGASILEKNFKYDLPKMGSPYKLCPKCETLVNMRDKKEWGELTTLQKKSWSFRNKIYLCIALSGFILLSIIELCIAILANAVFDATVLIFLLVNIVLFVIIYINYKNWLDYLKKDEILVSSYDVILIRQSYKRLREIEPLIQETEIIKNIETDKIINFNEIGKSQQNTNSIQATANAKTDEKIVIKDAENQQRKPINNFELFEQISVKHNLHIELNFEIIELIYSYVENTCSKYELENFVNIDREKLYNLFIEYSCNNISTFKLKVQVQNHHFWLMATTIICCILITDESYKTIKNEEKLWKDAKSAYVEDVDDNLKENFLKIMDKCYINWHLNQFLANKTIAELDKSLDGGELLIASIITFAEKHSFNLKN